MNIPDFWESMTAAQEIPNEMRATQAWDRLKGAYDSWAGNPAPRHSVPKIIHQIWLGSPIPKLYARWGETWKKLNPGWEYKLWTEVEIRQFGLKNQRSYDLSPNFGVKSDIARYEILERLGGVYADTDFECLVSFDALAQSTEFFSGLMYGTSPVIANGLIGSRPHHPLLIRMIADLTEPFLGSDGMAILDYCGPGKFTRECLKELEHGAGSLVILPTSFLYPFPNRDIELKDVKTARRWARSESLAIHYWEVSWRTQNLTSRIYWWMKKFLPRPLFVLIYRLVKGRNPE